MAVFLHSMKKYIVKYTLSESEYYVLYISVSFV
jgi:hypothetical protein